LFVAASILLRRHRRNSSRRSWKLRLQSPEFPQRIHFVIAPSAIRDGDHTKAALWRLTSRLLIGFL
jgi:hypothetical protein